MARFMLAVLGPLAAAQDMFLEKNVSSLEPVNDDKCDLCLQVAGIFTKIAISKQTCSVAIPLVCTLLGDKADECKQMATPVCEKVVQALEDGDAPEKIPPVVCKALQLCDAEGSLMESFAHHADKTLAMMTSTSTSTSASFSPDDPNDAKCDGCLAVAGLIAKVAISDTTCQVIGVICGLLPQYAEECKQIAVPVFEQVVKALEDGDAPDKIPPFVCKSLRLCEAARAAF